MGNLMGCIGVSKTPNLTPRILSPTSLGVSVRNTSGQGNSESSSSGNSGFSFGEQLSIGEASPGGELLDKPNLRVFSFGELKNATKNFKPETLSGEGGFGKVYKGWIDYKPLAPSRSGVKCVVAIKKLNSESVQGFEGWQGRRMMKNTTTLGSVQGSSAGGAVAARKVQQAAIMHNQQ